MSYSNPAPPGPEGDRAPLATNDDFRRMLADRETQMKARAAGRDASGKSTTRRKNASGRPPKNRPAVGTDAYRDRAKERREREDDDVVGSDARDVEIARGVFERDGGGGGGGGEDGATKEAEFTRKRSIEESKYLGGDVERTHLVKGLDFALLNKVRTDIEDARAMKEEEKIEREEEAGATRPPKVTSKTARALHEFLTRGTMTRGKFRESFASGAVSYSFDLSAKSKRDVPTTLLKSTDDDGMAGVRALRAYVDPKKDASLLTRLGKLMHYLKLGSTKAIKKFRRDERKAAEEAKAAQRAEAEAKAKAEQAAKQPQGDASSDEDIFADVGKDYEPSLEPQTKPVGEKSKSFFGDGLAGGEASAPAPKAKTIAADDYVEDDDADDRPVNAFGISGGYDECYPGYDVDVDDTGGFDKRRNAKDEGDAEGGDKESEKKEALRRKRQMGNELSKIRSMMKDKFGDKDDVAFKEDRKRRKK